MRDRIISLTLCTAGLVGLLTSRALAQFPIGGAAKRTVAANDSMGYRTSSSSPRIARVEEQDDNPWSPETEASGSSTFDDAGYELISDDAQDGGCESCDSCGGDCVACFAPHGLSAGVEATFLKPSYQNNNEGLDPPANYGVEAAPRVWLHWQAQSGWGVRGRYWTLDAWQQLSFAVDSGDLVAAQSYADDLDLYAVDLELTRTFIVRQTEFCASFGARNGRLHRQQTNHFSIFDLAGGGGDDASAILQNVDRDLNGTGITMALGIRRPFQQSRLAAICNLRGSVIWGKNQLDYSGTVIEVLPVGVGDLDLNDFQNFHFPGCNNQGMWIGELQAGGEWNTPINNAFGGGNAIVRILFEAQWWNLPGVSTGPMTPSTNDQLYQFVGLTAVAGFTR